jgi:pimeloyl-ACP methyl ester carboxylesterase
MRPVVLLPSLGRPAGDFDRLVADLAAHGRHAVAVDLPGVASAADRPVGPDLHAVAAEVAGRIDDLGPSVHLVGHALGNRVARCLAADRPERVASLVLLGCGGKVPGDPDARDALLRCFTEEPGSAAHLRAVATAFFAPDRPVPPAWATGWWPEAAAAQGRSAASTPWEGWWVPPDPVPVLAVVGRQDRISPPANAEDLVARVGERGRLVVVDDAGHALLPEQPDRLAEAVTGWLEYVDP